MVRVHAFLTWLGNDVCTGETWALIELESGNVNFCFYRGHLVCHIVKKHIPKPDERMWNIRVNM